MSGHLFLHIGPPKTATTALQVALEALTHPEYIYVGTYQPRGRNGGSLSDDLYWAVMNDPEAGARASENLQRLLGSGKTVMISEEMLSLEQDGITTAAKIARLGDLMRDMAVTVLVTLRSPTEALPSLYQQLYLRLPIELQSSFALFCSSGRATCFDYQAVADNLAASGLTDVRWIDFSKLRQKQLNSEDIFGSLDRWNRQTLDLLVLNVSAKQHDGRRRISQQPWRRMIGKHSAISRLLNMSGLRRGRLVKFTNALLDHIPWSRTIDRDLTVPDDRAAELTKAYQALRSKVSGGN